MSFVNNYHLRCRIRNYPLWIFHVKNSIKWSYRILNHFKRFNRNMRSPVRYPAKYEMKK